MTASLSCPARTISSAIVPMLIAAAVMRPQDGMQSATADRDRNNPAADVRMVRAQAGLYKTLPRFIGAVTPVYLSGLA